MFEVQWKGHRIGPDWYTEATFTTKDDAEQWLADHGEELRAELRRCGLSDVLRVHEETGDSA